MAFLSENKNQAISIHVPARGTTLGYTVDELDGMISIHVPARGTTVIQLQVHGIRCNFNPRPREGDDIGLMAWESLKSDFNPRPREGDDAKNSQICD